MEIAKDINFNGMKGNFFVLLSRYVLGIMSGRESRIHSPLNDLFLMLG